MSSIALSQIVVLSLVSVSQVSPQCQGSSLICYISVSLAETGTVRAEDWSYQDSLCPIQEIVRRRSRAELEVDKGIRQVEFILSSVLRERSCNLRGEEAGGGGGGLLSDIETQIRQLELGHATLGRVIASLKSTARIGESHCSVRPATCFYCLC